VTLGAQRKSSWPRQAAIVISDSPNVHMLLRELLRSYNWTVIDSTPSHEKARDLVRTGQAFLVIADDTLNVPSTRHVRYLLSDPMTICTPVMSFLLEAHKNEIAALTKMGRPQIVEKPLTPSKFIPGFINLVKMWEKEPWMSLRRANYEFLGGRDASGIRALAKLMEIDQVAQLCAQSLALRLRKLGKVKEAETVLLNVLKRAPRELGTMMALADLYLHTAMPKLAHRLLLGARTSYAQSLAMVPDLVQAEIMTGQLGDAINSLNLLLRAGATDDDTIDFLGRLLFAEGRETEAERVLNNNKTAFKKIQTAWVASDNQSGNAA
jgi:Flp pilus assembly protein TadD